MDTTSAAHLQAKLGVLQVGRRCAHCSALAELSLGPGAPPGRCPPHVWCCAVLPMCCTLSRARARSHAACTKARPRMQARSERLDVELYRTRHEVAGWQRQADEAVERERALQHELQHERAAAVQRVDAVAHERDQLLRALKLFQHSREENSEAAAAKEDALRVALTQAS